MHRGVDQAHRRRVRVVAAPLPQKLQPPLLFRLVADGARAQHALVLEPEWASVEDARHRIVPRHFGRVHLGQPLIELPPPLLHLFSATGLAPARVAERQDLWVLAWPFAQAQTPQALLGVGHEQILDARRGPRLVVLRDELDIAVGRRGVLALHGRARLQRIVWPQDVLQHLHVGGTAHTQRVHATGDHIAAQRCCSHLTAFLLVNSDMLRNFEDRQSVAVRPFLNDRVHGSRKRVFERRHPSWH